METLRPASTLSGQTALRSTTEGELEAVGLVGCRFVFDSGLGRRPGGAEVLGVVDSDKPRTGRQLRLRGSVTRHLQRRSQSLFRIDPPWRFWRLRHLGVA